MIIIKTMSENIFTVTDLSSVFKIDLIIFILLIGLLILREILDLCFVQHTSNQPDTKLKLAGLIDAIILPFIYIFCYVLIFKLFY